MKSAILSVILASIVSAPAMASHYDRCTFTANVLSVSTVYKLDVDNIQSTEQNLPAVGVVKITEAIQHEGHGSCDSFVGSIQVLEFDPALSVETFTEGKEVQLGYDTMGGRTQTGFWSRTSFSIIR